MSFHTITMFVRWGVTADEKTKEFIEELRKLPLEQRKRDVRIPPYVEQLRQQWARGTKIEKLATLGWLPYESEMLLCDIVENIEELRKQYKREVTKHGQEPPELRDEDLALYENKSNEERKLAKLSATREK